MPTHWVFSFQRSGLLFQLVDPGLVLCVGFILPCRSFRSLPWCCVEWLSTYLVRWLHCIWITAWQKFICVIRVVHGLLFFPGWPTTYWLSDWQAQYYSYSSIHSYPSHCGSWLSVTGSVASGLACSPSDGSSSFSPLGPPRCGSAGILQYHSMPALLHLGNSTTFGGLGVECLQPFLDIWGKLCFLHCISSSSSVQVSGRTCQRSSQTFDFGGTMLNGGSLASHST